MDSSDLIIAVIGVTGAGKTSFISKATGRDDLLIGHNLNSCTHEIGMYSFDFEDRRVTLIDTPGFDDTQLSDTEILKKLADFMLASSNKKLLVNALIYMHPVTSNRLMGSERKRTRLFEKILGGHAYSRVIITTTMWDNIKDHEQAERHEKDRAGHIDGWGSMIKGGAVRMRHDNNKESALKIIRTTFSFPSPVKLQLQQELENNQKLSSTSAGKQLDKDLGDVIKKLEEDIAKERQARDVSEKERDEEIAQLREQVDIYQRERFRLSNYAAQKLCEAMETWLKPFNQFVKEASEAGNRRRINN